MVNKVILVFKTHCDIGFTDLAERVVDKYAGPMLDSVLKTCRETEEWGDMHYVWTLPAWTLTKILEKCEGERKRELEHFIRIGQIAWHALAFTSHTDFCGENEYLESLRYGKRLSETYGKPYPIAAKMTDVPGHGLMLPEILGTAGVKFLHLGCNEFSMPPKVPGIFWWEAPSGKRVLTMYHPGGYGSGIQAPSDWKYPVWMALIPTQDNKGPDTLERLTELKNKAQNLYPGAKICCGTMDDFYREISRCDLSELPVVKQDLADTWIQGVSSYPAEISRVREIRRRMRTLEVSMAANAPEMLLELQPEIDRIYENLQLFGEHTWGADVKTWLDPDGRVYDKAEFTAARRERPGYQFLERSWNEQRSRAQKAEILLDSILRKVKPVLVNAAESEEDKERQRASELTITQNGHLVSATSSGFEVLFDEKSGRILHVADPENQRLLFAGKEDRPVFGYHYYRYGLERMTEFLRRYPYRYLTWGVQDFGRTDYPDCRTIECPMIFTSWEIQENRLLFHYKGEGTEGYEKYGNAGEATLELTFLRDEEEMEVRLSLSNKQATPYIESGSLEIPFPDDFTQIRINKNGMVIDPETDIAEDANHCFYCLENFTAVTGKKGGLCVIALDTPLLSLGQDAVYDFRHIYQKDKNILCFNLFNNMWGTNFPQWIEGSFTYRFLIRKTAADALAGHDDRCCRELDDRYAGENLRNAELPDFGPGMEVIGVRAEPEKKGNLRLTVRNLVADQSWQSAHWSGYSLQEIDYYGRPLGEMSETVFFDRKPYSLHIFRAVRE